MRCLRRPALRGSRPGPGRTCLLALLALHLGGAARAEGILVFGDSISVGSDDEPVPEDRCPPGVGNPLNGGWASVLECRLRARGDTRPWTNYSKGGSTSWWAVASLDEALAAAPEARTLLLSFHVNDCARTCGSVCSGGSRSGLACTMDTHCPSGSCDSSNSHPCSSAETRANLRTIIDTALATGFERVLFWKSPGRIGGLEGNHPCGILQFDGSEDAIDTMFLSDPQPIGYADEPRVEYLETSFRAFCPGSGLQGCGPPDAWGDRRRSWFSHDQADGNFGNLRHIHPNAWGYMEIAARIGERLVGEPLNRRPPIPVVVVSERAETSLSIRVLQPADDDGDPLSVYAWAACADTRGTSPDPACDRLKGPDDPGPVLPRECGALAGSDHDGLGATSENPPYPVRHTALATGGEAVLDGLAPDTEYRICAVAWDGFQGSYLNDAMLARTLASDADGDGVPDGRDVCRDDPDPGQHDADLDGYGNACDADYDGDGIVGLTDLIALRLALGATSSDPGYELRLDIGGDGAIGASEVALLSRQLGGPPGPSGLACAGAPPCLPPEP
jgi:hypothetical protein